MSTSLGTLAPLEVFITDELRQRPPRQTDYLREKRALQDLARQMVDRPAAVLDRLVELAMDITGSTSSGISLFEERSEPSVFRWHHVRGELARFNGATTPRDYSPCGITLDRGEPTLTRRPERAYTWISDADITCPEVLLVPLYVAGTEPLGTLWVVAKSEGFFDSGHGRVLTELASFAGIAIHMLRTEQRLKEALEQQERLTHEQEMLTKEMSHRVKNLFAMASGMINVSARSAATPKEMAHILSGRLNALAEANALVRRSFGQSDAAGRGAELVDIVRKILLPHSVASTPADDARFDIEGPSVRLGEHATNGFALVFHELATNASKYGALASDAGMVRVSWLQAAGRLEVQWLESGGPVIGAPPAKVGFGTTLAQRTIVDQFQGKLCHDWRTAGLAVVFSVPLSQLSR